MENKTEMSFIANYMLNETCYDIIIINGNYMHGECLQLLMSKIIGYSIILITSTLVKIPQIMKIMKSGSAEGVSLWSHIMLTFAGISTFTYGMAKSFPVSVWGENIALASQNAFICVLICLWGQGQPKYIQAASTVLFSVLSTVILMQPTLPLYVHNALALTHLPLATTSKIIQIMTNIKNSGTGQLSLISICMLNFRSFGRFFTYFTETSDLNKMAVYASASVLNVVLLIQMYYYNVFRHRKDKKAV